MNTTTPPMGAGWRALALGALAAVTVAAVLTLGADPAQAAYTARVQAGTLKITGDAADDTLALRLGSPSTLEVDVGEDGSADFSFDRNAFTRSTSRPVPATTRFASTRAAVRSPTRPSP